MRLVVREDMYVEATVRQEIGMSCSEKKLEECHRDGPGGRTSHFQKLFHISSAGPRLMKSLSVL
jgi:hypothetical protein